MRYGFTTGSCAAAASKAAAYMLLTGKRKTEITIETPKGIPYTAQLINIVRSEKEVSCAVEKDGGDDSDITTGALIYAKVSYGVLSLEEKQGSPQIVIDGGIGVGRVTKPGLDQPVGNAAINHVPREMIEKEVRAKMEAEKLTPENPNLSDSETHEADKPSTDNLNTDNPIIAENKDDSAKPTTESSNANTPETAGEGFKLTTEDFNASNPEITQSEKGSESA